MDWPLWRVGNECKAAIRAVRAFSERAGFAGRKVIPPSTSPPKSPPTSVSFQRYIFLCGGTIGTSRMGTEVRGTCRNQEFREGTREELSCQPRQRNVVLSRHPTELGSGGWNCAPPPCVFVRRCSWFPCSCPPLL